MRCLALILLASCSRPVAISPDPVAPTPIAPTPIAPTKDAAVAIPERHFMDTSSGSHDCYDEVTCKPASSETPCIDDLNGKLSEGWSKRLQADAGGSWCCYSRTLCEFPAP